MAIPSSSSPPTLEQLASNVVWLCLTLLVAKKNNVTVHCHIHGHYLQRLFIPLPLSKLLFACKYFGTLCFFILIFIFIYVQTQAWSSMHFHSCPLLHLCSNPSSTPLGSPNPTIVLESKISKKLINWWKNRRNFWPTYYYRKDLYPKINS